MTPAEAARRLRKFKRYVKQMRQEVTDEYAWRALELAWAYSSGRINTKRIRGLYARRNWKRSGFQGKRRRFIGAPDPGIINLRSGAFRQGWRVDKGESGFTLYNVARHAIFMQGTEKMIERPIDSKIVIALFREFEKQLAIAVDLAWNKAVS